MVDQAWATMEAQAIWCQIVMVIIMNDKYIFGVTVIVIWLFTLQAVMMFLESEDVRHKTVSAMILSHLLTEDENIQLEDAS